MQADDLTAVADSVLLASRVLVAVAVASLADIDDMSLPQFRALSVLAGCSGQTLRSLAEALRVNPSTATRLCDRLGERGFVQRSGSQDDRREVRLSVTPSGLALVDRVINYRRSALAQVVARMPPEKRLGLVEAMQAFGKAAGEVPHQPWSVGWSSPQ